VRGLKAPDRSAAAGSWPLVEHARHFDLGHILNAAVADAISPPTAGELGIHHAGLWEYGFADAALTWSGGVYDMFGFDRGYPVTREQALSCYAPDSRSRMERLRAHAIRHRLGFTLDVEIRAAGVGQVRHVRLIGAPVYEGDVAVRIHGLKLII
jgi:hypothetical protein